jgi:hypothetical protein
MPAGYSGTPLLKKLGIAPTTRVQLIHPPKDYFQWLQANISSQLIRAKEIPQLVHLFAESQTIFIKEMKGLEKTCKANPSLSIWVSWYKKSSGILTDLTEDIIREYALSHGLVDIKVCAVSEQWSGLKLVVPVAKRGAGNLQ